MPELPASRIRRLLLALPVLLGAGCAASTSRSAGPSPAALPTASEVELVASLIRLEDERSLDEHLIASAAASPSPTIRAHAAITLGRLRRPRTLPVLRDLLRDADTAVAASAAFALGQVGDTAAAPWLTEHLHPPVSTARPSVAAEAAYALGKLRSDASRAALRAVLATALTGAAPEPVGSALLAIWRFPRSTEADPIARWLESPDPGLRWRAAYALSRRPDPVAILPLLSVVEDADPLVRSFAMRGLTGPPADSAGVARDRILPHLLEGTRDTSYAARITAIRTLGTYPEPGSVSRLEELLASSEPHVVLSAAESLGRIGTPAAAAAPALAALAARADAHVAHRQAALEALGRVAPGQGSALAASLTGESAWRLRAAAARVLASAPAPDPVVLDRLSRDPDGRVASAAIGARLDAAGDSVRPLRPLLLEALGSADVWVRTAALGGLTRLRDPATLPALLDAYERAQRDTVNDALLAAVDALAALEEPALLPQRAFFGRFRRSPDPLVRLKVADRFADDARTAWGEPLPVGAGRSEAEYGELARTLWLPAAAEGRVPRIRIETSAGTIELDLAPAEAPLTAESFLRLTRAGFFEGQEWPRVVPNFVLQGGDPRGDTNGGPGYSIRDEISRLRYGTGALGMALSGPDTGGSQFFITHSPQPHLDGTYAVFGRVVSGQSVAERLLPGDRILRVTLVP